MQDPVDVHLSAVPGMQNHSTKPDAKTTAERSKSYRERQKSDGLKAIKCHLPPETIAYLEALREIHGVTLADAISLAVIAVIRGEQVNDKGFLRKTPFRNYTS